MLRHRAGVARPVARTAWPITRIFAETAALAGGSSRRWSRGRRPPPGRRQRTSAPRLRRPSNRSSLTSVPVMVIPTNVEAAWPPPDQRTRSRWRETRDHVRPGVGDRCQDRAALLPGPGKTPSPSTPCPAGRTRSVGPVMEFLGPTEVVRRDEARIMASGERRGAVSTAEEPRKIS